MLNVGTEFKNTECEGGVLLVITRFSYKSIFYKVVDRDDSSESRISKNIFEKKYAIHR